MPRCSVKAVGASRKIIDGAVKGAWLSSEDLKLESLVAQHGPARWNMLAQSMPGRAGKQLRERWLNHLCPAVNKAGWSEKEERILVAAHSRHGNKWSLIAKYLPGRPENSIKNHWNSALRKRKHDRSLCMFGIRDSKDALERNVEQQSGLVKRSRNESDASGSEDEADKKRRMEISAFPADAFSKFPEPVPSLSRRSSIASTVSVEVPASSCSFDASSSYIASFPSPAICPQTQLTSSSLCTSFSHICMQNDSPLCVAAVPTSISTSRPEQPASLMKERRNHVAPSMLHAEILQKLLQAQCTEAVKDQDGTLDANVFVKASDVDYFNTTSTCPGECLDGTFGLPEPSEDDWIQMI